uniref:Beta-Casp domain-containing protein n=1 Tax=Strigamia maritima TaxID=126957 RepID=T1JKD7_STRMM
MKLYYLSNHPNKPCNILKFKSTTLMLDCGLDMTSCMHFLPIPLIDKLSSLPSWTPREVVNTHLEGELKECSGRVFVNSQPEFCLPETEIINFSEVDVILISNYLCMLALPFITECYGFRGVVYMTEPTLQIGRLFMEEVVEYIERTPHNKNASRWKAPDILKLLPPSFHDAVKPHMWKQWYTLKDVNNALSRVQMVGFSEIRDVFGALTVTPISSGFCLGSCNWLIQSDYEKIAYISGSSTLTTHPRPMDQTSLKNADLLIMNCLTQTPLYNPDTMLGEFCMTVAITVRNGGNVLVPCYPSGVTYDLFECLSGHLDHSGLTQVPMFFVSPVADSSLAYSNIFAEWLSQGKQSKVYLPEEPFPHAHLVRAGRLKHFKNIYSDGFSNEFRSPCIMFSGHPSLRFGDAVHFIELWGGSGNNTVVFTEPDFPYLDALAPYQPLAMKYVHCPIDTGLSYAQANKLIRDLKPSYLVVPEQYTLPPPLHPHRSDLVLQSDIPTTTVRRSEVVNLPIRRQFEQVELEPYLAMSVVPVEIRPGVSVTTFNGLLVVKDNKYAIKPLNPPIEKGAIGKKRKLEDESRRPVSYTWGTLDVDEFVQKLAKEGITDVKVEESATGHIVHLPNEDTLIQVEGNSTHIFCESDEKLRHILRDALLQCLNKF